ncbi:hemerythrin domain-containing protein [Plantactinospora sp. GCM10030261]|uniref:hemerythrin domain-containing protein n=1 Tax=Plantactinospora sp. GCM10030261 TaxID=3273420 RepID=UPI0036072F7C
MSGTGHRLDMTMMYTFHDALRRDLDRLARITARADDDPRQLLRSALGWQLFTTYLRVHHTAEDIAVWPAMTRALAGRPDDLALLDAMEAEHAAIDPLLAAVDAALADPEAGPERLAAAVDALRTELTGHLRHEETEALALIDATLTDQQWADFGAEHRARIGDDLPRYLPWVLDEVDPATVEKVLDGMPAPIREAYRTQWRPAYADLRAWSTTASTGH